MGKSNKQILIVTAVFPPEPVVSALISYELAKKLSEKYSVTVLCPRPTRPNGKKLPQREFSNEPFTRIELNSYTHPQSDFWGRMKESYSLGKATATYIKKHKEEIDCIYMNTWPIFAQYFTLNVASKLEVPIVIHIQDIYPESMLPRLSILGKIIGAPLKFIDKYMMNKANRVLTISDNMKKYFSSSREIDDKKICVVRNWQDNTLFDKFSNQTKIENQKFTFMFVGSVSPAAGVSFIVKTFIQAHFQDARLIIAGDGSDKVECMKLASQYPDIDISFCTVSPETVPAVQREADVLLLPLKKGVGLTASPSKLPAYMFSAKPILACVDRYSDVEHIILHSNGGWVCSSENKNELIEMMTEIKELPKDVLKRKGESAQLYAIKHFTKEVNLKLMVDKIEDCFLYDSGQNN